MKNINNFGISNFKPFGEKIQRFKLKPLTLIYGPNSIGKSSVIHSIAYFSNLYKKSIFSPSEIKVGDTINLGGFENFIHQKDIDNNITLEFTYSGKVDHKLDSLRTGKYTFAQRKLLLSLSFEDISIIFKKEIEAADNDSLYSFTHSKSYLTEWFYDCLNDFDEDSLSVLELEDYISEIPEHEGKSLFGRELQVYPATRSTDRIYNKPLGTMEKFYENSSDTTKGLLNIHQLYSQTIKWERKTSDGWAQVDDDDLRDSKFDLNDDLLLRALKNSTEKQFNCFVKDLYNFIHSEYQLDDEITINTTIGKNKSNEICDLITIYSIGNEWLFKAYYKDVLQDVDLQEDNYCFFLNPKHEFIQDIVFNIEKVGNWTEEQNIQQAFKKNLVEFENENIIFIRNSFLGSKKSILLDFENIHVSDVSTFFEWNHEFQTNYFEYIKRSSKHINEDLNRMKGEHYNYDHLETDFDISNDAYESISSQQDLLDMCEDYDIYDLSNVVAMIVYSWIIDVNKSIAKNSGIKYIGPLRSFPDRHEFAYADRVVDSDESTYAWELLKHDNKLQQKLNIWLSSDKLKTPYELKKQKHIKINEGNIKKLNSIFGDKRKKHYSEEDFVALDQIEEFSFFDKRYDTLVNIREMGLGVSQVLPILVSLFSEKNHIVAVEQPELHLHPAVQSDLADEFIKSYKNNSNTSLIETHSEHLLLRLMKRMRQTVEGTLPDEILALTPEDISILYVDADKNKTYIIELQLDEDGSLLDAWPGGFFEEGFSERFF